MKDFLIKLGTFLHFLDDDGRLDLSDIAFIVIMIKIVVSPGFDFPSGVALATVILNKMQKRSVAAQDSEQIKELADQIKNVKDQVTPIIDKIKGSIQ